MLGDSGRGKTSLLRQLARTLPDELPGVLPVLVELRSLEKAPTLDELLAQHLVRQGVEDINPAKLRYMIRSGRLALLFDGFDELELRVGYDNAADYLQTLLESVTERAKVVLTSRTQHFRSTAQVRTALGERVATVAAASRIVVLEDFSEPQILEFLANLYDRRRPPAPAPDSIYSPTSRTCSAWPAIRGCWPLSQPSTRIGCAPCSAKKGRISAAELYRELVDFWLIGEANGSATGSGPQSLDEQERLAAARRWP